MELCKSILITGGGGMLARALERVLAGRGVIATSLPRAACDITSEPAVRQAMQRHRPSILVNCAAHTKVDQCEDEPQLADAINGYAVGNLARAARDYGTRLVHISTDCVFPGDGRKPYSPDDPVGPVSAYGRSKLLGETLLRRTDPPGWAIVRTAWLFGDGPCFPRTIAQRARAAQPLRVVDDQFGSPTYADDLAVALAELIQRNATGVWHVTNAGVANWHEVAAATLGWLGLRTELGPISTADYLKLRPKQARRPAYSVLDISAFEKLAGRPMRPWREALAAYCQTLK